MFSHRELLGLRMKMLRASNAVATGRDAEPRILDALKAVDGRLLGVRKPDRGRIIKLPTYERLVCD